jgi:ech hydrogenase subunit D
VSSGTEQSFTIIPVAALRDKVGGLRRAGYRLVQISATRLAEQVELTYSFDRDRRLANLRLQVPAAEARVPSISSIYWCAFLYENELHDLFNLQVDGMAVDFHGHFYETAVKFPFGSTPAPAAPAATPAPVPAAGPASSVPPGQPAAGLSSAGETPVARGERPAAASEPPPARQPAPPASE